MNKLLFVILFLVSTFAADAQQVKRPEEFLGYKLGERFTLHYRMVEYFRHVDESMPNIKVVDYGTTYEQRPLIYAVIASPENFRKIEDIRLDNLKRAGVMTGTPASRVPIVWLSYNVHGNESSSMEAAMWTLYELANTSNTRTQEWLKNTVVIMDPCMNPDGRDRYAHFYSQFANTPANPDLDALEHHEPWPGGRFNHYLFDLNRDWAWLTQKESQQRVKLYNEWLPQIHVDFHEQGHNSPYYFAPAAEPFHEVISPWQREFQTMIGKNNAKYFDKEGWLYFTKEYFDLFYPGYGDTYPTYSGAIGMTYEQAGGPYGGTTVTTETGDELTLLDRITHHHTTGLSTIEITSQNEAKVIDEFEKYFKENNNNPATPYKTYVIKADNNKDKLKSFTSWMDQQGIRYGHTNPKNSKGFDYQSQTTTTVNISADDIIVSAYQPKSRFLTTVFEPFSKLPDSITYDITAWNLIYAHNLNAFALNEKLVVTKSYQAKSSGVSTPTEKPYAYIFRYQHINDVALLTSLLKSDVKVRSSERPFVLSGKTFNPGTLIITRRNNEHIFDFDSLVIRTANELGREIITTSTGFVDRGKDFGSSDLNYIKAPKVAMLFGPQTSTTSSGEVWHFFEQQLNYPLTQIGSDYFRTVELSTYNVLIVPEGYYSLFDEVMITKISDWVNNGGRLVLLGNANNIFSEKPGFGLKRYASDDEKQEAEKRAKEIRDKEGTPRYDQTERRSVSETILGAIYKVPVDNSHPLGFGLDAQYFSLKTNELRYSFLEHGWNVATLRGPVKPVMGFAGYKSNADLKNSLVFGVENKGRGHVVYMIDNPLFRSFWDSGKLIFSNAVFMVGQ
jgi:hypothetical protein